MAFQTGMCQFGDIMYIYVGFSYTQEIDMVKKTVVAYGEKAGKDLDPGNSIWRRTITFGARDPGEGHAWVEASVQGFFSVLCFMQDQLWVKW